ncbi:DinB family protein [Sporosarcina highlanderae]|uniref:DinB family protein n=1 Tax=Sporosarcina highlanderae TaxID=3035916 RepID=A0ABT8JM32_9BACL|nr:DinB family protein [Sporosarcina highlanderae]MDN4606213.1 DinB family protein [Sporosarcina highlanderae]
METIAQLKFARMYTMGRLSQTKEDTWDKQPTGFNNTIRWNVGHLYISMEQFAAKALPDYEPRHSEWDTFFGMGTSPAEWEGQAPSQEELEVALQEQLPRVLEALEGKLDDVMPEPLKIGDMLTMGTVDAVMQFALWHEGLHAGVIHALNRAIG